MDLSIPYPAGTAPIITIQMDTSDGTRLAVGEIDSGSDRSLCPLAYATDLGIESDLVLDESKGSTAVGAQFPTWSAPSVAITGQIVLPVEGGVEPWGTMYRMDIAFADGPENLLLGRADFFATFDVKFLNQQDGPALEICECPRAIPGP